MTTWVQVDLDNRISVKLQLTKVHITESHYPIIAYYMFIRSSKAKTAVMANVHLEHERSWKSQKLSVRNHYGHFYSFFSSAYKIIYNY